MIIIKLCIIIISFLCLSANELIAQDLIVTTSGDTLNCKITGIRKNLFYVEIETNNRKRNTILQESSISYFEYNYYMKDEQNTETERNRLRYVSPEFPETDAAGNNINANNSDLDDLMKERFYQNFRFSFSAGLSRRIARTSDVVPLDLRNFVNSMKTGYTLNGDVAAYFDNNHGVGFVYNYLNRVNGINVLWSDDGNVYIPSYMENQISISYVGPFYSNKMMTKKHNIVFYDFGVGLSFFEDNLDVSNTIYSRNFYAEGNCISIYYNLGFDVLVSNNFTVGASASAITGVISKIKYIDNGVTYMIELPRDQRENITRLNFLMGFTFVF